MSSLSKYDKACLNCTRMTCVEDLSVGRPKKTSVHEPCPRRELLIADGLNPNASTEPKPTRSDTSGYAGIPTYSLNLPMVFG